ncbi:hypothetical protein QQ045_006145 [Rhodiola kirilowii]
MRRMKGFRQELAHWNNSVFGKVKKRMNELKRELERVKAEFRTNEVGSTKAPGPDGFSALFYQEFWNVVKKYVVQVSLNFLNGDEVLQHDCISESQSAFVPGQLITDNILIAHEMINIMRTRAHGGVGYCCVKLDMTKAYDRMEWAFLEEMQKRLGFPSCWISKVMKCVKSSGYRVKLNDVISDRFFPDRGIRQGDPLSPYLFVLYTEWLTQKLELLQRAGELQGIKFWWKGAKDGRYIAWVDRQKLQVREDEGGLGLKNFMLVNLALLVKQAWRILNKSELLLSKVYKARYFNRTSLLEDERWLEEEVNHQGRRKTFSEEGAFSTRAVYGVLMEEQNLEQTNIEGEASNKDHVRLFWRKFWRVKGRKYSSLVLGMLVGSGVMKGLLRDLRFLEMGFSYMEDWIWYCLHEMEEEALIKLFCGARLIWWNRNQISHNQEGVDLSTTVMKVKCEAKEILQCPKSWHQSGLQRSWREYIADSCEPSGETEYHQGGSGSCTEAEDEVGNQDRDEESYFLSGQCRSHRGSTVKGICQGERWKLAEGLLHDARSFSGMEDGACF